MIIILLLVLQFLFIHYIDSSIGAPVSDVVTHSQVNSQKNGFTNQEKTVTMTK